PLVAEQATAHDRRAVLVHVTRGSGLRLAAGMDHVHVGPDNDVETTAEAESDLARVSTATEVPAGGRLEFVKLIAYGWPGERAAPVRPYTEPEAAGDAVRWRHPPLDVACERAGQLGLTGAAFPWRTIAGQECSGYWPAGTAAFHINADVADATARYQWATGDEAFVEEVGAELLIQTARLWRSLGHYAARARFRIDGVT